MSFELSRRQHIEDELKQIATRQLRRTTRTLGASAGRKFSSAIHESRRSIKKVRAVVELLEQTGAELPGKDRKRLKSAAKALSRLRDSVAIIETFDRVRRRFPKQLPEQTYGILRRGLVGAREREEARAQREGVVSAAVEKLEKTRRSARKWAAPSIDVPVMIAVLAASYGRSRNAMRHAAATRQSATVHRWRKYVKTLGYQLRLAQPLMTGFAPLVADLKRLGTALGDDHNLVVLGATLRGCHDLRGMRADIRQVERLAARTRQALRRRTFALGGRVHVRTPEAFADWLRASSKQARAQLTAAA